MAKAYKKILVPVDGSANSFRGLNAAIDLAKITNGAITAFYTFVLPYFAGIKYSAKQKKADQDKAVKAIGAAMQRVNKEHVPFVYVTRGGTKAAPEIVKYAQNNDYDLIVIGARGMGATKEMLLGSVSNQVVHTSKVPVMVVR